MSPTKKIPGRHPVGRSRFVLGHSAAEHGRGRRPAWRRAVPGPGAVASHQSRLHPAISPGRSRGEFGAGRNASDASHSGLVSCGNSGQRDAARARNPGYIGFRRRSAHPSWRPTHSAERRHLGCQHHSAAGTAGPWHSVRSSGQRARSTRPSDRPTGTGVSNLVSPPALNLPSIPGVGIPLPNQVPIPSDLLCVGTDWSASQGDSDVGPAVNSAIPRAVLTGSDPAVDRWGR
jgi:hypothetical protein